MRATGTRGRDGHLRVVFVTSPIRSRGCAEVGREVCVGSGPKKRCRRENGSKMAIALAAPWRFSLRRLGRLHEHEFAHIRGKEHKAMEKGLLLSLGPTPEWARPTKLRYYGSAPSQLPFLRRRNVRNVGAQVR